MPPVAQKTYWRSLEDLADTPEFRKLVEDEFPSRVDELDQQPFYVYAP